MKRIAVSALALLLSGMSAWAQAAAEPAASSGGSSGGWIMAVLGVIALLIVVARRISIGEAWKLEVPIGIAGIVLLNIGGWMIYSQKLGVLEEEKKGLNNQITMRDNQIKGLNQATEKLQQDNAAWRARDQEWDQRVKDWQKYSAEMKQRYDALAAKAAPAKPAPVKTKDGDAAKPATKSKNGTPSKTVPVTAKKKPATPAADTGSH